MNGADCFLIITLHGRGRMSIMAQAADGSQSGSACAAFAR
jgi:hypothetical protein